MADFQVILDGTVVIGEAPDEIKIPINTILPPKTEGDFVFDYEQTDPATAAHLNIAAFVLWVADTFSVPLKKEDLPASLQTLLIAVLKLHFDTTGNVDVKVQIGSVDPITKGWSSVWVPIPGTFPNFALDGVTIEATNMAELVSALLATDQLVAQAA
jgi:hypothetical protein